MLCSSKIQSRLVSTVLFVCVLLFESPSKILHLLMSRSFLFIHLFFIHVIIVIGRIFVLSIIKVIILNWKYHIIIFLCRAYFSTCCMRYPHVVPFLRNEMPFSLLKPPNLYALLLDFLALFWFYRTHARIFQNKPCYVHFYIIKQSVYHSIKLIICPSLIFKRSINLTAILTT